MTATSGVPGVWVSIGEIERLRREAAHARADAELAAAAGERKLTRLIRDALFDGAFRDPKISSPAVGAEQHLEPHRA